MSKTVVLLSARGAGPGMPSVCGAGAGVPSVRGTWRVFDSQELPARAVCSPI
jgi:hypothetical protein